MLRDRPVPARANHSSDFKYYDHVWYLLILNLRTMNFFKNYRIMESFMFNKWIIVLTLSILTINISCKKNTTASENTAPTASFTIAPISGTTTTTFTFDANSSSDNEDAMSVLQVRWDWENDGVWDTGYSTAKVSVFFHFLFSALLQFHRLIPDQSIC